MGMLTSTKRRRRVFATRQATLVLILGTTSIPIAVWGGIPEPTAIIYGQVLNKGVAVRSDDDVIVIARRNSDGNEIARYRMGAIAEAGDL